MGSRVFVASRNGLSMAPSLPGGKAKTLSPKEIARDEVRRRLSLRGFIGPLEAPPEKSERPQCRRECLDMPRPCPWVGCKWHLYLDVLSSGSIQFNFPELEPGDLAHTCALDVADAGEITLEQVGEVMNVTRERVRQIQTSAIERMLDHGTLDAAEPGPVSNSPFEAGT